jgi:mono/diheme cytochrome c family protein
MLQWAKHHVTISGKGEKNPVNVSAENIESGKRIFSYYCVVCHGRDGQNTGVPFAAGTSPPIPSLASADVQRYSDGQLRWIIENGISPSGMPASNGTLNNDETWHVVVYLRHLPPAGAHTPAMNMRTHPQVGISSQSGVSQQTASGSLPPV